jgi:quinol monooxygenase YgiN
MSMIAIASYKPKRGKEAAFPELLRQHIPTQRAEGLVSDRPTYLMHARDGTIIEVFEWLSSGAKQQAHQSDAVMHLWKQFSDLADITSLDTVTESHQPFAAFETLRL